MFRHAPRWLGMVRRHILNGQRGAMRNAPTIDDMLCGIGNELVGTRRWGGFSGPLSALAIDPDAIVNTHRIWFAGSRNTFNVTDCSDIIGYDRRPSTKQDGTLLHKLMGVSKGVDPRGNPLLLSPTPQGFDTITTFKNGGVIAIGSSEARLYAAHWRDLSRPEDPHNLLLIGSHPEYADERKRAAERQRFLDQTKLGELMQ